MTSLRNDTRQSTENRRTVIWTWLTDSRFISICTVQANTSRNPDITAMVATRYIDVNPSSRFSRVDFDTDHDF
jgi:hypothetical protein